MEKTLIKSGTCKAPGKLIVSGEHSVVYGKPALVMAVDRHLTANLELSQTNKQGIFFKLTGANDQIILDTY